MFDPLLAHIRRFVSLAPEEEKTLLPFFKYRELKKRETVLKEGQLCHANHFILKGCLRMHSITEKGEEQIVQFAIEHWWITDYMSLDQQKPSEFSIQAVEPSAIAVLDKSVQDELFARLPQLERYFRLVLQRAYAAAIMRVKYIFTESGEERFHNFNNSFPEFIQRIPQYMLASYLGFTPEFLSKIRAKKN
jgi:CRP/FNR family transcriptional regulator